VIVKLPGDLSLPHDVHVLRFGLSGVEEVVLRQTSAGQDLGEVGFLRAGLRDGAHGAGGYDQGNELKLQFVFHT
jgi:hypothetical protein